MPEEGLIADLVAGENGKLKGDNLDLRITTNDMRIDNRNQDLHYFASDFVMDKVVDEQLNTRGGNRLIFIGTFIVSLCKIPTSSN